MITDHNKAHMQAILNGYGDWFTAHLLRLCARADHENLNKLKSAFPETVQAYIDWQEGRA